MVGSVCTSHRIHIMKTVALKKLSHAWGTRYYSRVALKPQPMPQPSNPLPPARLVDLPTELLQLIAEELDEADLVTFAVLTRRLHYLALPAYLHLHGISDPTRHVTLRSNLCVLRALRISLFVTSIETIHCQFNGISLMHGIRGLERLVSRLSHVGTVHIDLSRIPPNFLYFQKKNYTRELSQSMRDLLVVLLAKLCKSLTVGPGVDNFPGEIKLLPPADPPRTPLGKLWGAWGARSRRSSMACDGSPARSPGLNVIHVHSSILLHPPFCNWTLKTLNTSPITSLSLALTLTLEAWAAFLSSITLPSLVKLAIQTSVIPLYDLATFISRHNSIATLNLEGSLVFVQPVTPPNIFFPRLHTLSATPQCIFYLLRPVHTFPLLRTINILPPMSFALRDEFDDFETLERAMTHVAHTTKDTYLSLQLAGDSGLTALWLKNTSAEQGSLRFPECTSIRLSSSNLSRFSDAIVTYLPGWLRRFPGLRHVEFGDGCFSENAAADLDLISAIGRACAGIQTIQIRSQKNPISIWLAQKS